jgi:CMP-N-acetylneuraminic acid synthetase
MKVKKKSYQIIIPARGGSKRFPKKNIVSFIDKPLIAHSIEFALMSFSKENIWVNTDDDEIEKVAKQYSVQITKRPEYLGLDNTSTAEVLAYQCEIFTKNKIYFDAVILLQPTNPIRPNGLIESSIMEFELSNRGSLATFSKLNKKYGKIVESRFNPTNYNPGQRMQTIVAEYYENGLIYITKNIFLQRGLIISDDVFPYVIDKIEASVDIDEPNDLLYAEYVYESLKRSTSMEF